MKTKLMVTTDWVGAGTGFSEEMRNVLFGLAQTGEYEIYWVGYNYLGMDMDIPDTVFPDLKHTGATIKCLCGQGPPQLYGLMGFRRNFDRFSPDFFMSMGDPDNFKPYSREKAEKKLTFPYVAYTTLDGTPPYPGWRATFTQINVSLAMTEWAMLEYQKYGFPVGGYIHHGVNWEWMATNRVEKARIKRTFGIPDDCTLFIDWNTNQFRKRQDALLRCWKEFHPENKNAKLFLYTDSNMSDSLGWDLELLIEQLEVPRETILLPEDVYGRRKYWEQAEPIEFHKMICSMGDILVSCTSGEGFGKVFLEGLSLGIPVIAPSYAALPEVCERGSILVPLYEGNAGKYRLQDKIGTVYRGIVNEEKMVEAMLRLYDNPKERQELGAQGREWAQRFDYDTQIIPGWKSIFDRIDPYTILTEEILRGLK